jgi:hypothetical protein
MPKPDRLPSGAHEAATRARIARADERAAKLAPLIKTLQAAGVTSLTGMAAALNERRVPTSRGQGQWHPMQVARLLKRLAG